MERKTYRESLQNNRDQILLSKKLATIHYRRAGAAGLWTRWRCSEPDIRALRELYQNAGVHQPAARSGPAVRSPPPSATIRRWLRSRARRLARGASADAPVAVAVGEMMSETVLGLGVAAGVGIVPLHTSTRLPGAIGRSRREVAAAPLSGRFRTSSTT